MRIAAVAMVVAAVALCGIARAWLGFRPTEVPQLRGIEREEATDLLESMGLQLTDPGLVATNAVGPDRILEQDPAPGVEVPRGSSVEITVAVSPQRLPVPDVRGEPLALALTDLAEELYQPVTVELFDARQPAGTVIDQLPSPNTEWLTGRPVAVGVSAGEAPQGAALVPDVSGLDIEHALGELTNANLRGDGFVRDVKSPDPNVVVRQLPGGGTLVRPGTTVLLLFKAD